MGNWRNRPRRSFYRHKRNSVPNEGSETSESSYSDNGVPAWEKRFCRLIGSVPWKKVVNSKKFMSCYVDILRWDDSANREAFWNAKNLFWAKINGLPCAVSPPDPDLYIEKTDWDTKIEPELIEDLEKHLFVPRDEEGDQSCQRSKKTRSTASGPTSHVINPWEPEEQIHHSERATGWGDGHWKAADNPWEHDFFGGKNVPTHAMVMKSERATGWGDGHWKVAGNPWEQEFFGGKNIPTCMNSQWRDWKDGGGDLERVGNNRANGHFSWNRVTDDLGGWGHGSCRMGWKGGYREREWSNRVTCGGNDFGVCPVRGRGRSRKRAGFA